MHIERERAKRARGVFLALKKWCWRKTPSYCHWARATERPKRVLWAVGCCERAKACGGTRKAPENGPPGTIRHGFLKETPMGPGKARKKGEFADCIRVF